MGLSGCNPTVSSGASVHACCFQPLDCGDNFYTIINNYACIENLMKIRGEGISDIFLGMFEKWSNCPLALVSLSQGSPSGH